MTITWLAPDARPAPPPLAPSAPPKPLTYQPVPPPADLSAEDWSTRGEILALTKRTIPSDSTSPPAEVLAVIKEALLAHFAAK
jgi:hypothetical protein